MIVDFLVPLAAFASFVLMMGQITRLLSNIALNRTLRDALREHPDSVPLLAERLNAREPWADALIGWIFLAFAFGMVLLALFEPADDRRDLIQAAIIPAIVGLVALAFVRWAKGDAEARPRPIRTAAPTPPPPVAAPPPVPRGRRSVRKPA